MSITRFRRFAKRYPARIILRSAIRLALTTYPPGSAAEVMKKLSCNALKTRPPIQVIAEVIEASIREDPDYKSDGPIDILHLSKDGARWVQKKRNAPKSSPREK